jgi:hypothetical protein
MLLSFLWSEAISYAIKYYIYKYTHVHQILAAIFCIIRAIWNSYVIVKCLHMYTK